MNKLNFKNIRVIKKISNIALVSTLFGIIIKNLKLITRSKSSALLVLLGPLLVMFLVGTSFNSSSINDIKIGTFSNSYSELTDTLLNDLTAKQFKVIKYDQNKDCIESLKNGNIHVCAIIPDNLVIGHTDEIEFFVDQSRINIVWLIIDTLSSRVSTKSSEVSLELTTQILDTIADANSKLADNQLTITQTKESTGVQKEKVQQLSTLISGMNLDFSASNLRLGLINSKLQESVSSKGLNQSEFQSVFDAINLAKNASQAAEQQIADANINKIKSLTEITNVDSQLTTMIDNVNALDSTIASIKTKIDNIKIKDPSVVVSPIKTKITPVIPKNTHLNFLFPTLITLVIMFISLLLSSTLVIRERTSSAYFRNVISPTHDFWFIVGDYIANMFIILLQIIIIFIVGAFYFNNTNIWLTFANTFLVAVMVASVFIFLGMMIGYIFNSEETSTLATIFLGCLFLLFSSTILPLETLPLFIKELANFNPFVISDVIFKQLIVFNESIFQVGKEVMILALYVVILFIFVYAARQYSKKWAD